MSIFLDLMNHEYPSRIPYDWETRKKYLDLPFPITEYQERIKKVQKLMDEKQIDSVLMFGDSGNPSDLVYFANFIPFGRAAIVIIKNKSPTIITDAILHGEPINSHAWMTWLEDFRPVNRGTLEIARAIVQILEESNTRSVGVSGLSDIPSALYEKIKSKRINLLDISLEISLIKSVKSDREVELLKELGKITVYAMQAAIENIGVGKKENEIAGAVNKVMLEQGAHDRAFLSIVNSGAKAGLKHSYPTNRKIIQGDMVYIDIGAMKFGYMTDMSRTVVVGKANQEQKEILDVIYNGYMTLVNKLKPGLSDKKFIELAKQLEQEAQYVVKKYPKRIFLGLSVHHPIGTTLFGFPSNEFSDINFQENMCFAFEPMAHILDFGTAVIEDDILITRNGYQIITPYDLIHW